MHFADLWLLAVLVPIWLGLLYALVTFGIPDY